MVTGQSVRARSWLDGPPANLPALAGSEALGSSAQISLDGRATQCAAYRTRDGVNSVLRHFRALAEKQTQPETPYLEAVQPGGATLVWVDSGNQRRGVIIEEDVRGGARYTLLWGPPPSSTPGQQRPTLPLGLTPPSGCDVVSSALSAHGGTSLLAATGEPSSVARRFVGPLRQAGFTLDTELPETPRRVAFSFRSPTHAGLLVAAAGRGGQVRVSLSIQPALR